MDIEVIFDKLFDYYKINTFVELADKLNISQPALSQWKTRNSISAIKKKCREIGIYNDIFGDINSKILSMGNNSRASMGTYYESYNQSKGKDNFDTLTVELIKKAIDKFGSEEEFQFQFMDFLRDK